GRVGGARGERARLPARTDGLLERRDSTIDLHRASVLAHGGQRAGLLPRVAGARTTDVEDLGTDRTRRKVLVDEPCRVRGILEVTGRRRAEAAGHYPGSRCRARVRQGRGRRRLERAASGL